MTAIKRCIGAFLALVIILSGISPSLAAYSSGQLSDALKDTAAYIYSTVKAPQVGSVGGEWAVMSLARSGYEIPMEYYHRYYATLEAYVTACGGNLHDKKYTEYSRVILALSAMGKDPRNVAGHDLLKPLGDYNKTVWQGLNGPIWALIALDTGNYEMPINGEAELQATREMYINRILECQLADGGFSLFGGTAAASGRDSAADPDITGMALQALAKYQDRDDVKKAIEQALACLSLMQSANGGYSSWETENSESVVQVIVALCQLGIPMNDHRFVKNGNTLLDNLMTFYRPGSGFLHTKDGSGSNLMASEQGLYALIAVHRMAEGKPALYSMAGDSLNIGESAYTGPAPGIGLDGKSNSVTAVPVANPGITFDDISGDNYHINTPAIEALAARGIISGKSPAQFDPDATMTRAEFAAIAINALGLQLAAQNGGENPFSDVAQEAWYFSYVHTAYNYGIINGADESTFNPNGTVTRQEAAVMVARAAQLCGMDTALSTGAARDILAQFFDYVTVSQWALESAAFCYAEDILSQNDEEIRPKEAILRCEAAQMIFNLLSAANLL